MELTFARPPLWGDLATAFQYGVATVSNIRVTSSSGDA